MRNLNKLMATIPLVASIFTPIAVSANTSYTTSSEKVTNITTPITADAPTNEVSVSVSQASTFSVVIPKTIVLNGASGSTNKATYTVQVYGNIATNEKITVVPSSTTFEMKDSNEVKGNLTATISQSVTGFVDSVAKTKKFSSDATVLPIASSSSAIADNVGKTTGTVTVANLSAGSWSGKFNFAISLGTYSV
jgi:hypothetical protein